MGNPLTLSSSMTLGIVGNPKRVMTSFTGSEIQELDLGEGQLTGLFTQWIQHDALILPGNSGGPLVNLRGEVIGINELGGSGVGFAIPANLVSHVLNQALAFGEVKRGWIGVTIYPVERIGLEAGVLVASVQNGSPAFEAGIQAGDVILTLNDEPANAVFFDEIPLIYKRFADFEPGSLVRVGCLRASENMQANVRVAPMERYLADTREITDLGLTLRDITGPMALIRRYPDADGVLITGYRPGYPADETRPQLRGGDVIIEVNGKAVKDSESFEKIIKEIGEREDVLVRVRRGTEDVVSVMDTTEKKPPRMGGELPKAWIGIRTQVLTEEVAGALGLGKTRGFRVTQVFPETKAEEADLQVGDVITELNGSPLRAFRPQDAELLTRQVENLVIDETAKLTILRDGAPTPIDIVLEETPQTAAEVKTAEDELLEFKVREITFMDRVDHDWPNDQSGVIVTEVTGGGWASLGSLRGGDLLRRINDIEVRSIADFKEAVDRIRREQPARISIFVVRGYRTAFVFAEPEYPEGR
jgi:serine protease Do